jgi:hypothetical protein
MGVSLGVCTTEKAEVPLLLLTPVQRELRLAGRQHGVVVGSKNWKVQKYTPHSPYKKSKSLISRGFSAIWGDCLFNL